MKNHEIKRDKFQYIIKHPWGCPQRVGDRSGMNYTYITQRVNLPWELRQCGMTETEILAMTEAA